MTPRTGIPKSTQQKESARLTALREQMNLTQREMAEEFRVTHGAIGLWERGERTIPGPVLKLMELYEEKLKAKGRKES
jgi:transcriptional regulator with XRE-family HTH domain